MRPGDDLAALLRDGGYEPGDVLVVAHKVVSKAEGALRRLEDVVVGERARELAREHAKDPRHVQVILDESAAVVRAQRGVLICRTHHGFVCANAGVDTSNAPEDGALVVLPRDPDASARALRAALPNRPAVVVADSFGRAWRHGQCDVAIGIAGLTAARRLARAPRPARPRAARHARSPSPTRPRRRPTWCATRRRASRR